MIEHLRRHHISFKNAFNGIRWAFNTQPNFRVHFFLALSALAMAYVLKATETEIIVLILTIVLCLGIEMVNTSIEAMTDLITKEWRQEAKVAKDVAAGMMLLAATGAVVIGCIIFIPKLFIFAQ